MLTLCRRSEPEAVKAVPGLRRLVRRHQQVDVAVASPGAVGVEPAGDRWPLQDDGAYVVLAEVRDDLAAHRVDTQGLDVLDEACDCPRVAVARRREHERRAVAVRVPGTIAGPSGAVVDSAPGHR